MYIIGPAIDSIHEYSFEQPVIQFIDLDNNIYFNNPLPITPAIGSPLYIKNQEADTESYVEDRFKIDHLESLSDHVATFGLVSWLQYFKIVAPKRKYYKNTCQWVYKGSECQYPGPGSLPIPGTNLLSNASPIAANNQVSTKDVCSKSFAACGVRNNQIHFGGFYGVGRTIPRA